MSANGREEVLPLEEALVRLEEAEEERGEAERALREVLRSFFTTENTESTEGEK